MVQITLLFYFLNLLIFNCCSGDFNVTSVEDLAQETQHAVCKIISQEIETSANATITRQLKGVCTTKHMERQFKQLEQSLLQEFYKIKTLLGIHENNDTLVKVPEEVLNASETHDYDYLSYDNSEVGRDSKVESDVELVNDEKYTRNEEIILYNDTVRNVDGANIFTYYWKVEHIKEVLYRKGIHTRSMDFYVLGHQLCVQLYPNHLGSNYLGIQLRPSSAFIKKHKFSVLDQSSSLKNINSPLLGGIGSYDMYRIPNEKLEERKFIHDGNIIIKLIIYLDS